MRLYRSCTIFLLFLSLGRPAGAPVPSAAPLNSVTVQLKWIHQAQFAGFYMARAKGYYADEDIAVRFLEGGQKIDIAQPIISGKADFGIMSPEDVLIKRSNGSRLSALAAIYRRSAVVYTAMADSGIIRPTDLKGRTLAVKGADGGVRDMEFQFYAMMQRLDLDLSTINMVTYDPTYTGFYNKTVDVTAAYLTGGVIRMRHNGYKLKLIWPGDYGVHFYSDILVTSERMITLKPDLVEGFLRATLKGWNTAIGNPGSAVEATLSYARIKDKKLQAAMLDSLVPLVHTGEDHIGWMKPADWQHMHKVLFQQGIIQAQPNADNAFTMFFLKKIYGSQRR